MGSPGAGRSWARSGHELALEIGDRASVAGLVTAVSLLFLAMRRRADGPSCFGTVLILVSATEALGPVLGAWLARRVVKGGRRYFASLLVVAAWAGLSLSFETLPRDPVAVWGGGPLRLTVAAIGWIAGWIFVLVLMATLVRRSGTESKAARVFGLALIPPIVLLLGQVLLLQLG